MKQSILILLAVSSLPVFAQKTVEGFDIFFNPTDGAPRYYVITELKDGRWFREAYYIPEKSLAMECWYRDKACTLADSTMTWFFPNKNIKSTGKYHNGKKEGSWMQFHENGMMSDSGFYVSGQLKGIGLGWNHEGYQVDSSSFDGNGNGFEAHWFANGPVSSAGYITGDTNKVKRWNYYHSNGKLMATEDYENGKRTTCSCFTETGERLAGCDEREAHFPGEDGAWIKFLQKNLRPDVPVRKKAPPGKYTTMVQFIVDIDGRLIEFKPLTHFGYGMEEEVIRMLKTSSRWVPAVQFGRKVKAYRKQPVIFMVIDG